MADLKSNFSNGKSKSSSMNKHKLYLSEDQHRKFVCKHTKRKHTCVLITKQKAVYEHTTVTKQASVKNKM